MLGFYCLPFHKIGHAMTELWNEIILTWNWKQDLVGLQMEPKGTMYYSAIKMLTALKNQTEDISRQEQK